MAAAVITYPAGRVLLLRKRNTIWFMQPGGKIAPHEQAVMALIRELKEALNADFTAGEMSSIGRFTDTAANEPEHLLVAEMFRVSTEKTRFLPSAKIEEVIGFDLVNRQAIPLAPLARNHLAAMLARSTPFSSRATTTR
ncbi:NUDIX hydrolase [Serratia nevei]|uniref:NUDIX hydrolase n=1 Tax=Serratia nevei TaxID=2703794 RepID=UPI003F4FC1FB